MIDPKLLVCGKCGNKISTAEYASYGFRCEDCYVGDMPGSRSRLPAVFQLGKGTGRLNEPGSGKHQKLPHTSAS